MERFLHDRPLPPTVRSRGEPGRVAASRFIRNRQGCPLHGRHPALQAAAPEQHHRCRYVRIAGQPDVSPRGGPAVPGHQGKPRSRRAGIGVRKDIPLVPAVGNRLRAHGNAQPVGTERGRQRAGRDEGFPLPNCRKLGSPACAPRPRHHPAELRHDPVRIAAAAFHGYVKRAGQRALEVQRIDLGSAQIGDRTVALAPAAGPCARLGDGRIVSSPVPKRESAIATAKQADAGRGKTHAASIAPEMADKDRVMEVPRRLAQTVAKPLSPVAKGRLSQAGAAHQVQRPRFIPAIGQRPGLLIHLVEKGGKSPIAGRGRRCREVRENRQASGRIGACSNRAIGVRRQFVELPRFGGRLGQHLVEAHYPVAPRAQADATRRRGADHRPCGHEAFEGEFSRGKTRCGATNGCRGFRQDPRLENPVALRRWQSRKDQCGPAHHHRVFRSAADYGSRTRGRIVLRGQFLEQPRQQRPLRRRIRRCRGRTIRSACQRPCA